MTHQRNQRRPGMSLLEVLLALAILGLSLAVITELMRIGGRNAEQARDITTAQIHCESIMNQIVCGLIAPESITTAPVEDLNAPDDWQYSIIAEQIDQNGLLAVQVNVFQNPDLYARPVSFGLMRWLMDPSVMTTDTESTSGSSTSGSSTSDSSTSDSSTSTTGSQ